MKQVHETCTCTERVECVWTSRDKSFFNLNNLIIIVITFNITYFCLGTSQLFGIFFGTVLLLLGGVLGASYFVKKKHLRVKTLRSVNAKLRYNPPPPPLNQPRSPAYLILYDIFSCQSFENHGVQMLIGLFTALYFVVLIFDRWTRGGNRGGTGRRRKTKDLGSEWRPKKTNISNPYPPPLRPSRSHGLLFFPRA